MRRASGRVDSWAGGLHKNWSATTFEAQAKAANRTKTRDSAAPDPTRQGHKPKRVAEQGLEAQDGWDIQGVFYTVRTLTNQRPLPLRLSLPTAPGASNSSTMDVQAWAVGMLLHNVTYERLTFTSEYKLQLPPHQGFG